MNPEKRSTTKRQYRPEVDALRGLAIIAVVIYHFNSKAAPLGYLGVDLFFVLSGYIIPYSTRIGNNPNLYSFCTSFFRRRFRRIIPTLLVYIIITSVATCLFIPISSFYLKTALAAIPGLSNIYLYISSQDYFAADAATNPFTNTWSLGVEEQFYLLFPIFFWFAAKGRAFKSRISGILSSIVLLTIIIASSYSFISTYEVNTNAAFYLPQYRAWEFLIGILAFQISDKFKLSFALPNVLLTFLFCMFLLASFVGLPNPYSSSLHIYVCLITFIALLLKPSRPVASLQPLNLLALVGKLSYSIYLWHWPVIVLFASTVLLNAGTIPFALLLTIALSISSYYFIEQPFRILIFSNKSNLKRDLALALGAYFASSIAIVGLLRSGTRLYTGNPEDLTPAGRFENTSLPGTRINSTNCNYSDTKKYISSSFSTLNCLHIKDKERPTVFVVGDSHAMSLLSSLGYLLTADFNIFYSAYPGCPFPAAIYKSTNPKCDKYNEQIAYYIKENSRPGDAILITNYFSRYFKYDLNSSSFFLNPDGSVASSSTSILQIYQESLQDLRLQLPSEMSIFVTSNGLTNINHHLTKKQWFRPQPLDTSKDLLIDYKKKKDANKTIDSSLSSIPLLFIINPLQLLHRHLDTHNALNMYIDSNHYSPYAAAILIKDLVYKTNSLDKVSQ